ncbi:MAG TPA: tryptophan 2,3-dioxygenase family protein [Actinomycetota bacterium]|nr:tryptophan 2,3-dioxygenase family protein [Actinomycetota bacterium]
MRGRWVGRCSAPGGAWVFAISVTLLRGPVDPVSWPGAQTTFGGRCHISEGNVSRPRFGEEDRELSYGSYLKVPDLLSLQRLLSDPPAHDELLFIIVHQAYELWFKEVLFELESIRDALYTGDTHRARHYLERVHAIERIMIEHIGVIETMSPQDFLEFRANLAPASGFQSVQFREIEFVSGLKEPGLVKRLAETPEEQAKLERRLSEPTVWDGFCALLEANGLPMPEDDEAARRASVLEMMRNKDKYAELFYTAESLLNHDELFANWRLRHILMVERQIGSKTGTGGSTGVSYLKTTLDKRFYPELWHVRSYL